MLKKLQSNDNFVYLARAVDPAVASAISDKYPEVGSERQDLRQYPGGSLAANIVGGIDWDGHGLLGLEDRLDSVLSGTDGAVTYDRGSDGVVIPGSYRNRHRRSTVRPSSSPSTTTSSSTCSSRCSRRRTCLGPMMFRPSSWTPRPAKCWPWPTTTPSTRPRTSGVRPTGSSATWWCPRPSSRAR